MSTLSIDPPVRAWPRGCTVAAHGPLTTIALDAEGAAADGAALDRTAALALDLPGAEVLVIDVCSAGELPTEARDWVRRAAAMAKRAHVSVVVLAEPGETFESLREVAPACDLRLLSGSASRI
jgi:hypothetical protein